MMARAVLCLVLASAVAHAAPPEHRVVLADADPELRRAVEASLRPWRIEVVVEPGAPADLASAQERADHDTARFVVWRDGAELVVYDRQSGVSERRSIQIGPFDAVAASAAALSVKTMMRLPPPPPDDPAIVKKVTQDEPTYAIAFDAGLGARYEQGLDSNVALRFGVRAMIAPWVTGLRFGAIADFGASAIVDQASFKGTWSNWAVLAAAGYAIDLAPWQIEPWVAAGLERSDMSGTEMSDPRSDTANLLALRGGAVVRYMLGGFSVGAVLTVEGLASTQTYTKTGSPAQIFEIPPFGVMAGVVLGANLTR